MSLPYGIGWTNRRAQMYEAMRIDYCEAWAWRLRGEQPWRLPPTLVEQFSPTGSDAWMDAFAQLVGL